MRLTSLLIICAAAYVALAQQAGRQRTPAPERTFTSASEVAAMTMEQTAALHSPDALNHMLEMFG